MSGMIGAGRLICLLSDGERWEECGTSADRFYSLGNVQGPRLPPSSTRVKVSTVKGGAQLRRCARLPECLFDANAHRARAGGVLQRRGAGKGRLLCRRRALLPGLTGMLVCTGDSDASGRRGVVASGRQECVRQSVVTVRSSATRSTYFYGQG